MRFCLGVVLLMQSPVTNTFLSQLLLQNSYHIWNLQSQTFQMICFVKIRKDFGCIRTLTNTAFGGHIPQYFAVDH